MHALRAHIRIGNYFEVAPYSFMAARELVTNLAGNY